MGGDKADAYPLSFECLDRERTNATFATETILYYQLITDMTIEFSAFVMNSVIILAIVKYRKTHKGSTMLYQSSTCMRLVVNLAFSDLSMSFGLTLFAVTHYSCDVNDVFRDSRELCMFKYIPVVFGQIYSGLSLVVIAVDRYMAVFRSFEYNRIMSRRNCYIAIGIVWATAFVCSNTLFFWNSYVPGTYCSLEDVAPVEYIVALDSVFHFSVLVMISGIHYKLHRQACESNNSRSSIVSRETSSNIKSTKLVVLVSGVYLVCWAPHCIVNIIGMMEPEESVAIYYATKIVYPIRNAYCVINPFVYAWKNLEVRNSVRWFFRKCKMTFC